MSSHDKKNSREVELKKLSFLLPKKVHKSLKRLAVERDTSVTQLVTHLILSALEETPQTQSPQPHPDDPQKDDPPKHPRPEINLDQLQQITPYYDLTQQ